MTNLTGAGVGISFGSEGTWGDTTSVTSLQGIEPNSFAITPNAEFYTSNRIVKNRMPRTPRKGNTGTGGDVVVDLMYGNYDEMLEAAVLGTWATNTLKAGKQKKSLTYQLSMDDISTNILYTGNRVNTWAVTVPLDGVVTSTFTFSGKEAREEATSLMTPSAATQNEPFYQGDGTFNEGGNPIAYLTALSFTLENGYTPNYSLGDTKPTDMTYSTAGLTGEVTAYVPDLTLFNKFLDETVTSLDFTLADPAGNTLQFVMPKVKYSGAPLSIDDDQAVNLTLPFTAYYDASEDTVLKIVRS